MSLKDELHKAAKEVSAANMRHEAAMKTCIEIMNKMIEAGDTSMVGPASELEQCFYMAKANHSRLNRVAVDALGWEMPVALGR